MLLTLDQYKQFMRESEEMNSIINEFRKAHWLFDNLPFEPTANISTGGKTAWIYNYNRIATQTTVGTRSVNEEYTPESVTVSKHNTELSIVGGAWEIDRAMIGTGYVADEMETQTEEKIEQAKAAMCDLIINGDNGSDDEQFDGLDVTLTGSTTEANANKVIDLSDKDQVAANYEEWLWDFDTWLNSLNGRPDALLIDDAFEVPFNAIARKAGQYNETKDSFGNVVRHYRDIPFVKMGEKSGVTERVIGVKDRTVNATPQTGLTDIFAVRFGKRHFHGVSPSAKPKILKVYLPTEKELESSGVLKKAEVEAIISVALKQTKSAGVFRNTKVQP